MWEPAAGFLTRWRRREKEEQEEKEEEKQLREERMREENIRIYRATAKGFVSTKDTVWERADPWKAAPLGKRGRRAGGRSVLGDGTCHCGTFLSHSQCPLSIPSGN